MEAVVAVVVVADARPVAAAAMAAGHALPAVVGTAAEHGKVVVMEETPAVATEAALVLVVAMAEAETPAEDMAAARGQAEVTAGAAIAHLRSLLQVAGTDRKSVVLHNFLPVVAGQAGRKPGHFQPNNLAADLVARALADPLAAEQGLAQAADVRKFLSFPQHDQT
ncbi:MAG: hypothetical protein ACJ8C4_01605 [Gemmataceae bacterium]